jgi:hypothetical protein
MTEESGDLGEAARRGMQRAGVHLMRAAIEVIEGVSAFLEEMQRADGESGGRSDRGGGIERIELDGED